MDDNVRAKLEAEAARGASYARVWESHLKPFFDKKQKELFEVFTELPTTDQDALMTVKLQSNALRSLQDEFTNFIDTGKLAQQTLDGEEKDE